MSDAQLEKILDFNESDLNANRNGSLTEKQKRKLAKDEKSNKWFMWILTIVCGAVAIGPFVYSLVPVVSGKFNWTLHNILNGIGCPTIWAVGWGFLAFIWFRSTRDKYNYKLLKAEGSVKFINSTWGDTHGKQGTNYELHVARKKFEDFDLALMDVMEQGDEYAIYYLNDSPAGRIILSAELLGKKKPAVSESGDIAK